MTLSIYTRGCQAETLIVPRQQGGDLGQRIVAGVSRFFKEVTEPSMVFGMAFGMTAFNVTRAAVLPALMRSIPFAARFAASFAALVPELGACWGTSKFIDGKMHPGTHVWDLKSNVREILGLGMTLGFLKSFGFIFGRAGTLAQQMEWAYLPKHPVFWQQSGMLAGIMAGHGAEISLGWRAPGDVSSFLTDSLITLGQFKVGDRLSQKVLPGIHRLNENIQARMEAQSDELLGKIFLPWISPGAQLAMAGAYGNPGVRLNRWNSPSASLSENTFAMSSQGGSSGGSIKRGLVVEGGGMRGAHTGGVLNALRDHGLTFDIVTGSSAGSNNAAYWVDGYPQMDMAWRNYLHGDRFIRYRNLFLGRPLLNMDYLYQEVFRKVYPLNHVNEASIRFFITVTDCETGQPYYVENKPGTDILGALFAGAAMPFGYPLPVKYGDRFSADGGITDSVPFQKALDHGASDLWIILTRPKGYRKSSSLLANYLNRWMFGDYPALVQAMARRSEMYNDQLATIERMEKAGRAIVIRPSPDLKLSRLQRNQTKLHQAIEQGYKDTMLVLKETGFVTE